MRVLPSRHPSAGGLVQSMAKANRVDSTHIRTVLAHVEDRRGVLDVLLDDSVLKGPINVDIREARTVEAFVCHLLGTSFHGLTFSLRPGPDRPFPSTATLTEVAPGVLTEDPEHDIPDVFSDATLAIFDTARRSTSVFDGTAHEEFLVQLPETPGDGHEEDVRMSFRDVAMQVAGLTTAMGQPLSVLHAPVAVPALRGAPRDVTGPCLRVGVAFPQYDDSAQLRFGSKLVALCCAEGYGLWQRATSTADTEHDYWQPVVPLRPDTDCDTGVGDVGGDGRACDVPPTIDRGLAVTCAGPARSGSTEAILQVLEQAGAPLAGLAETTLDDIALVHLFTSTPLTKAEVDALPTNLRADVLLSRALGLTEAVESDELRDYRVVVSSRKERRQAQELAAIWVTWAAPASNDALRLTVRTLRTALDVTWARYRRDAAGPPSDGHLTIGYLLCREVSIDWLRGRMRISVDLDALGVRGDGADGGFSAARLGQFCSDLERQWRASLSFALGTPHVDLDVVWRESWMGRWVSLREAPRDDLG